MIIDGGWFSPVPIMLSTILAKLSIRLATPSLNP